MAESFHVKGKTTVRINTTAGQTAFASVTTVLGQTDADDEIQVQEKIFERKIHTNGSGPEMFEKVINLGRNVIVRVPLIEYDLTQIDNCLKTVGATDPGDIGTLGGDRRQVSLALVPTLSGSSGLVFPYARLVDSADVSQWGLKESKYLLVFEAYPNPSNDFAATDNAYIREAV